MVQKFHSQGIQHLEVRSVPREEAHIQMRGAYIHASCLGGIERSYRFLDITHGIRVLQLLPQHYHAVRQRAVVYHCIGSVGTILAAALQQRRKQRQHKSKSFHLRSVFVRMQK